MKKHNAFQINIQELKKYAYSLLALSLLSIGCSQQTNKKEEPVNKNTGFKGKIGRTLAETQQAWPDYKSKAPEGAPNVIYILIDDIGYGASTAFGGLIPTPNIDSLANHGLRYTNFHTTAICSPTRTALLTGANHHSGHIGSNTGAGTPGYDRVLPFEKGFVSEILKENGYNTLAVGKWHLAPKSDQTQAGPFNRWPVGRGFEHYFGFLGGATDQNRPILWEGTNKVEKAYDDPRLLSELITDKAISYIADQKSVAPEKPFFLYYAPAATHSPHQVDKFWSDKFKGKFDKGWDWYRETVLERQKKAGVVPEYVTLADATPGVKKWSDLSEGERKLFARHFEVYAGYLAQLDFEIGKLINYLKDIEQLDNTLIFLSIGDNMASRGSDIGNIKVYDPKLSPDEKLKKNIADIDLIGTPASNVNYPTGWSQAANTPFRYHKADANGEGGSHNPLIVFWPKHIKEKGIRNQYTHVTDILPTTLELLGIKSPEQINGYKLDPIQGVSFAASIDDAKAVSRHTLQYYEINGSRAIYKDGWKAGAWHEKGKPFDQDKWELFKLDEDFNEHVDLATKNPEKLAELKKVFDEEAAKYNIYPLKDGSEKEKFGEPGLFDGKKHIVLYNGVSHFTEVPEFNDRSFTITADVDIQNKNAEGVLFALGGQFGGLSLFIQSGKLKVVHNNGYSSVNIQADKQNIPLGKSLLKLEIQTNTAKKTATAFLYINQTKVGEAQLVNSQFKDAWDGISVGKDDNTAVSPQYKAPYAFTGKLKKITIDFN
ncbi:MAG TPA: arylsulfatase [Bacteroidia bacterium]|jgi:arylsulfatase|nr:arylsulfatase [Bacteroidia bacterium]